MSIIKQKEKGLLIVVSGPSGAGKSTIADLVAEKLSYVHLDTGAMYRSVAYAVLKNGLSFDDEKNVSSLVQNDFDLKMDGKSVVLNGEDITDKIRTNEISMAASNVSKLSGVRSALVAAQRKIAANKGYILDGRDICDVVLPDAEVKVFLTASAEDRARRRLEQNKEKGIIDDYDKILEEIKRRDYQDSHRAISPLKASADATIIDSSDKSIDEVVNMILDLVYKKI